MRISDWSSDVCSSDLIANLVRKAVKEIAVGDSKAVKLDRRNLDKYAGVPRYRYGEAELEDMVGVSTGLAWTEVGGEMLSIEAVMLPGKGKVTSTGKLGDVMKESIQAAESRSEEHTSELQSLMRNSYAVLCLKKTIK